MLVPVSMGRGKVREMLDPSRLSIRSGRSRDHLLAAFMNSFQSSLLDMELEEGKRKRENKLPSSFLRRMQN